MSTITRIPRKLFIALEKQLASQRDDLRMRIDRHRMDVVLDHELDDETAAALENISRDMPAATLERERRTLREIESAIFRIKKSEYGTCGSCGAPIPNARLNALPWAGLCVHCAETNLSSSGLQVAF